MLCVKAWGLRFVGLLSISEEVMKAEERMKLLSEALEKETPESLAAKLRKYKAVGPVVPQSKFTAK